MQRLPVPCIFSTGLGSQCCGPIAEAALLLLLIGGIHKCCFLSTSTYFAHAHTPISYCGIFFLLFIFCISHVQACCKMGSMPHHHPPPQAPPAPMGNVRHVLSVETKYCIRGFWGFESFTVRNVADRGPESHESKPDQSIMQCKKMVTKLRVPHYSVKCFACLEKHLAYMKCNQLLLLL